MIYRLANRSVHDASDAAKVDLLLTWLISLNMTRQQRCSTAKLGGGERDAVDKFTADAFVVAACKVDSR